MKSVPVRRLALPRLPAPPEIQRATDIDDAPIAPPDTPISDPERPDAPATRT
jgi:hypothetical protein